MANYDGLLRIDVDIHCPRCGRLKIMTLKRFVNAINDGSPLMCGDCDSKFIIKLELLDPPARTPDTAETPIRGAEKTYSAKAILENVGNAIENGYETLGATDIGDLLLMCISSDSSDEESPHS